MKGGCWRRAEGGLMAEKIRNFPFGSLIAENQNQPKQLERHEQVGCHKHLFCIRSDMLRDEGEYQSVGREAQRGEENSGIKLPKGIGSVEGGQRPAEAETKNHYRDHEQIEPEIGIGKHKVILPYWLCKNFTVCNYTKLW